MHIAGSPTTERVKLQTTLQDEGEANSMRAELRSYTIFLYFISMSELCQKLPGMETVDIMD